MAAQNLFALVGNNDLKLSNVPATQIKRVQKKQWQAAQSFLQKYCCTKMSIGRFIRSHWYSSWFETGGICDTISQHQNYAANHNFVGALKKEFDLADWCLDDIRCDAAWKVANTKGKRRWRQQGKSLYDRYRVLWRALRKHLYRRLQSTWNGAWLVGRNPRWIWKAAVPFHRHCLQKVWRQDLADRKTFSP